MIGPSHTCNIFCHFHLFSESDQLVSSGTTFCQGKLQKRRIPADDKRIPVHLVTTASR